jgi:hypothetical protein
LTRAGHTDNLYINDEQIDCPGPQGSGSFFVCF